MSLTGGNANGNSNGRPNGESDDATTVKETVHGFLSDIKSQLDRLPQDAKVVRSIIGGLFTENVLDDRK